MSRERYVGAGAIDGVWTTGPAKSMREYANTTLRIRRKVNWALLEMFGEMLVHFKVGSADRLTLQAHDRSAVFRADLREIRCKRPHRIVIRWHGIGNVNCQQEWKD